MGIETLIENAAVESSVASMTKVDRTVFIIGYGVAFGSDEQKYAACVKAVVFLYVADLKEKKQITEEEGELLSDMLLERYSPTYLEDRLAKLKKLKKKKQKNYDKTVRSLGKKIESATKKYDATIDDIRSQRWKRYGVSYFSVNRTYGCIKVNGYTRDFTEILGADILVNQYSKTIDESHTKSSRSATYSLSRGLIFGTLLTDNRNFGFGPVSESGSTKHVRTSSNLVDYIAVAVAFKDVTTELVILDKETPVNSDLARKSREKASYIANLVRELACTPMPTSIVEPEDTDAAIEAQQAIDLAKIEYADFVHNEANRQPTADIEEEIRALECRLAGRDPMDEDQDFSDYPEDFGSFEHAVQDENGTEGFAC